MRGWLVATVIGVWPLAACGGQVQANATPDAGSEAAPITPCHAGDPAVALVTGLPVTLRFNGMAADSDRLYLAQSTAPLLWSMPMLGGPPVALYGSNVTDESISTSTPLALLPSAGGIYFDAIADPVQSLMWVEGSGGSTKTVSSTYVGAFDASHQRGFALVNNIVSGAVSTVSLVDGSVQPLLMLSGFAPQTELTDLLVTETFVHAVIIDLATQPFQYTDRRIDLVTGLVHDEVPLDAGNDQIFMGPTAICVISTNDDGISCLSDDAASVLHILGPGTPTYVDKSWVYAPTASGLSRFSLSDGHEQVLASGGYPDAVTSFGDCVYAAMLTGTPLASMDIWRFSPGP